MSKDKSDEEMLATLGVDITPAKKVERSAKEQRIIAGFEEFVRFTKEHGEEEDVFERIYAERLDQIRGSAKCCKVQEGMNAEEVAKRDICEDFDVFRSLFSDEEDEQDLAAAYIDILRSLSDEPFIAENRSVIHKIGVTGGDVKKRVANAKKDPTYLLADVEIVRTFKLANINRKKLETLLHKFFADARLDLELKDRFGHGVEPREWFLIPLPVILDVVEKLKDGTLAKYAYVS